METMWLGGDEQGPRLSVLLEPWFCPCCGLYPSLHLQDPEVGVLISSASDKLFIVLTKFQ